MKSYIKLSFITACLFLTHTSFITSQEITILHTNDMHSKLTGYGPESEYSPLTLNNDQTLGGFARLATIIKETKDEDPEGTMVFDAGDFLMGSLFHVAEEETGFQLHLMKEMGYDAVSLGNHEFDFGPETLVKILYASKKAGGYPDILSSNIVIPEQFAINSEYMMLDDKFKIKDFTLLNKKGLRIAVFGLMGLNAYDVAPASKPVSFKEPLKFTQKFVDDLKGKYNPDLIICLSHSGLYPTEDGNSYIGEDIELANKVKGIDIIISGHTHVLTPQAIHINDTWIVQTGEYAQNIGKIKLRMEEGEIAKFDFNIIAIDDKIKADPIVHERILNQKEFLNENFLSKVGLNYEMNIAQTDFDLMIDFKKLKESNLGPFVADADKFYLESVGVEADFTMVASGTIRENLLKGKHGFLTVPDAFRVMSLGKGYDAIPGYPLAKIYITAKELKKLCEILVMSRAGGGDGYLYTSGLKVYIRPDKMMLRKVQKVELNGKEIDVSKKNEQLISIAADTYLLSFIGRIKEISHGLVTVVPKDKDGNPVVDMKNQLIDIDPDQEGIQEAKEWIALIEYMKSFPPGEHALPLIPDQYKKGDESLIELPKK